MELLYGGFIPKIAAAFDKALGDIEAQYNFDYGPEFEVAICTVLRRVLPHRFGVCRGFVVTPDGETAGDDIVIYEKIRFPTARILDDDLSRKELIPIEAALAYLEAKHTLTLTTREPSSFGKAMEQVGNVKALCEQRAAVPLNTLSDGTTFTDATFSRQPGWPEKRNPFYSAIFARNVQVGEKNEVSTNPDEIKEALIALSPRNTELPPPDLMVCGANLVCMPVIPHGAGRTVASPFADTKAQIDMACFPTEGLAFAVGLAHMLWALDSIHLGRMPWPQILGNALGVS